MGKAAAAVGIPIPDGDTWRVPSATRPGGWYRVRINPYLSCQCGAWVYSKSRLPCKHMKRVRKFLEEEGMQRERADEAATSNRPNH
jgi:hypothetical protein